jgi:hypothetical protein
MIEIKEHNTYLGAWFVSRPALEGAPDRGADFLGVIWREPDKGEIFGAYRFRYIADDKLFEETDDTKSWYTIGPIVDRTDAEMIAIFDDVVESSIAMAGEGWGEVWRRVDIGDGRAFHRVMATMPVAHMRIGDEPKVTGKGGAA